ncbi:hypothetical protein, partial [Bacillus xiapuensis]|nr:hypothetical protein [Bacillus xiapuensis]
LLLIRSTCIDEARRQRSAGARIKLSKKVDLARKFTLARVLYIIEETRLLLFVDVFVCLVFKEQYHS